MTDGKVRETDKVEERGERALEFLRSTNARDANLRHAAKLAERKYDATVDAIFKVCDGSIEARKVAARTDPLSEAAYMEYLEADRVWNELHNERETEKLALNWCQSLSANRRWG